jgi:hypothetical protein
MLARIAVAVLLTGLLSSAAYAEKRVALVIGNGAYQKVSKLANPTRDAAAVAALFKTAGFDAVEVKSDLGATAMRRALRDFSDVARDADVAVVYYAGHGIEVNGTNYLIPVDATLERDVDVEDEAVPLERLTQLLDQAKRLRLVILDACRDNPFMQSMRRSSRSIGRGLARVEVPTSDILVAFAAKPGFIAADGDGTNSPYTTALLKHLATPGLDLRLALGRVRDEVLKSTNGKQEPYVSGSLGGSEIALVTAKPQVQAAPQAVVPAPSDAAQEWSRVDKSSMAELETFIRRNPLSAEADYARGRLEALKKQQVAVAPPVTQPAAPPPAKPVPEKPQVAVAPPAVQPAAPPPAKPVPALPPPEAKPQPTPPGPVLANLPPIERAPWNAASTEVAGWRLRQTTRLGGALSETAVSLDRASVAVTGHRDGSLHVIDALTLKPRAKIMLSGYEAYSLGGVALLPDGKRVAVVRSGTLEVYDIASKARLQVIPSYRGYDKGYLSVAKDGQRLYFIRSSISPQRSTISIFKIASEGLVPETEHAMGDRVDSFDVTADGRQFLLGTYGNQLVLYDAGTKKAVGEQICQCSARFGAGDRLVVFAGRPDASAGDWDKNTLIGVLDVANPDHRITFDTRTKESLDVEDVSPDGLLAAVGSTNNGQVSIVPISLDRPNLRPLIILKDNSGQSIAGAKFVGLNALVTTSGDNNARLWKK